MKALGVFRSFGFSLGFVTVKTLIYCQHEKTILELAQIIINLTDSHSEIIYNTIAPDDPKKRKPDITKAKNLLGWEPKVSLEEGLLRTIEYFRDRLRERKR